MDDISVENRRYNILNWFNKARISPCTNKNMTNTLAEKKNIVTHFSILFMKLFSKFIFDIVAELQ